MSDYVYKNQYGVFAVLDRSKMEEPKVGNIMSKRKAPFVIIRQRE